MSKAHKMLLNLGKEARSKLYPIDQIIIYAGDPPQEVYVVKSGYVKVYDIDNDGNEKILSIIKPDDIMPYAFYSGSDVPNRWFYQALVDTEVYVFDRLQLQTELKSNPKLMFSLINNFSLEVHELLTRISSLGKSNVHDKLLALLRYFATCIRTGNQRHWWRVPFPVNQQFLADVTGMTRESCSLAVKELVSRKLVRMPKVNTLEINISNLDKAS